MRLRKLHPLPEILAFGTDLPAEEWLEVSRSLRTLVTLQEYPDITLIALSGIYLPPHERTFLYLLHWGAGNNVLIGSRGTSKSATTCGLYPTYKALVFPRRTIVELSATGFRGGQLLFMDMERWLRGGWDSQEQEIPFFRGSIPRSQILTKSQSFWTLEFDSFSKLVTLPTRDHDMIRGQRGQELYIDEANTTERILIDKVAMPFLNVKSDFRHGGAFASDNQVFFTSTIDYNWRPFQDRVKAAREGLYRDMRAADAIRRGDYAAVEAFEREGLNEYTHIQIDYTDLLIRRFITNRAGKRFEVRWPNPDHELVQDPKGIPFTERDEQGNMLKYGQPVEYYQTYPLDKRALELPLFDGAADEGSWLSEQRNIVDQAAGDVYAHELVDRAACRGDRYVVGFDDLPEGWRTRYANEPQDYTPPVLWKCEDPCVLGADYAPQSDFCAFVVIRLGPLAKGEFSPFTHHGHTTWSNVVWVEQHRQMSNREAADKIRQLADRYNLIWFHDPAVTDPWEACRAIGMDMRGGGTGVRDELCFINDAQLEPGQYRIYDPFDDDERIRKFAEDPNGKPMLDAIWPSDELNDKLVTYTIGQMQSSLLYIPKYLNLSDRPQGQRELYIAYDAALALDSQLRKLRQAPTKNWRTFYIEGNTRKDQNKKDLWAAFIYAAKQMRAHVIRQRLIDDAPPPMGARVIRVGTGRGLYGHVPGAKD